MSKVAIIGTGLLGRGIAMVVARAGNEVILHDAMPAALDSALMQLQSANMNVRAEPTLELAVADADFVIEAVIENLELKQSLFERMGKASTRAILMSNSSVLPIGQIAARTALPARTVGTHWWNPPELIPVVEVVRGPHTTDEVMQRSAQFLTQLGKTAVRVERDVPGFVGNRLQHALWREALSMVSQGECAADQLDRIIAMSLGRSLAQRGPIAEMRLRGQASVLKQFEKALPTLNNSAAPAPLLVELTQRKDLGAKSGQGLLAWPEGKREQVAQILSAHVKARVAGAPSPAVLHQGELTAAEQALAARLECAVWREALALLATRVCDAETVDLMTSNTIGMRLAVMGPISNADYVGLDLTQAIHQAVFPSLDAEAQSSVLQQRLALAQIH